MTDEQTSVDEKQVRARAVRDYLQAIKNPEKLVDTETIARLEIQLEQAEDPNDRIRLRYQLLSARNPRDLAPLQRAFVKHVKGWLTDHQLPPAPGPFREEGVPDEVLLDAGLLPRQRATRKAFDALLPDLPPRFKNADVQERTGWSSSQVSIRLRQAAEQGQIRVVGKDGQSKVYAKSDLPQPGSAGQPARRIEPVPDIEPASSEG